MFNKSNGSNSSNEVFATPHANTPTPSTPMVPKQSTPGDNAGYLPFPNLKDVSANTTSSGSDHEQYYSVIFGTSITSGIDGDLMSRGARKVINVSGVGNKIYDIANSVHDFCLENSDIVSQVDQVIVCIGANDIKFFDSVKNNISKRFRKPLARLVKQLGLIFPSAQIIFKCVLPIGIMHSYTVKSVHDFNYLLLDICTQYGCIFMDCFKMFLDREGNGLNRDLYRDRIHINDHGLKLLCRAIKFVIYNNVFNPYMRISHNDYYYYT